MWILKKLSYIVDFWPGKETFGLYRFLPIFFVSGAIIEYSMIHWKPNGINFYETFKAKQAYSEAVKRSRNWKEIEKLLQQ